MACLGRGGGGAARCWVGVKRGGDQEAYHRRVLQASIPVLSTMGQFDDNYVCAALLVEVMMSNLCQPAAFDLCLTYDDLSSDLS